MTRLDDWVNLLGQIKTAKLTLRLDFPKGIPEWEARHVSRSISNALQICGILLESSPTAETKMEVSVNIRGDAVGAYYGKVLSYEGAKLEGKITIRLEGKMFDEVEFRSEKQPPNSISVSTFTDFRGTAPESAPFAFGCFDSCVQDMFRAVFWLNRDIDFALAGMRESDDQGYPRVHVPGYRRIAGLPFETPIINDFTDGYAIFRFRSRFVADQVYDKLAQVKDLKQRYALIMGLACLRDVRVREIARREIVEHPENKVGAQLALYMMPERFEDSGDEFPPNWSKRLGSSDSGNWALRVDQVLAAGTRADQKALDFLTSGRFGGPVWEGYATIEALGIMESEKSLQTLKDFSNKWGYSIIYDKNDAWGVWSRYSRKGRK